MYAYTPVQMYVSMYFVWSCDLHITSFAVQVIQWVDDTGSGHVEITSPSTSEQEAQEVLQEHRAFMENDATVRPIAILLCQPYINYWVSVIIIISKPHHMTSAVITVFIW